MDWIHMRYYPNEVMNEIASFQWLQMYKTQSMLLIIRMRLPCH